jgi:hypothetical protein
MTKIEPAVGSIGGTRITVTAPCYGADIDLTSAAVQARLYIDEEWVYTDICQNMQFIEYGKLSCITKDIEVPDDAIIRLYNDL